MNEEKYDISQSLPSIQSLGHQENTLPKMTCRICFQQSVATHFSYDSDQLFRRPCSCRGTSEFAHEGCLIQWFNKLIQDKRKEGIEMSTFTCEVCKQYISVKMESKYQCYSCAQIKQRIRARGFRFGVYVLFFVVFVSIMVALAYLASTRLAKQLTVVVIIASVFFGIGSLVFVKLTLKQFIMWKKSKIIGVLSIPVVRKSKYISQINKNNKQGIQSQVRIKSPGQDGRDHNNLI